MIKFKAGSTKTGRELVGFGITAKNVEQLKLAKVDLAILVQGHDGQAERSVRADVGR